jgi:uncharacterized protein (TIGR03083 family)
MNTADVGALATEAVDFFIEAVEQIPSQSWDLPSNLEGWSIGDLVAHTTGTVAKIVTLVEGGQPKQGPADPDDWRSENPAAQLRDLAARLHDALPSADVDALRQPGAFGPAQPVPEDATPTARLMAYLGRPVDA